MRQSQRIQIKIINSLWSWDGTLERIHLALYVAVREQVGREASPTTAIIDSQSAKGAQKGGLARPAGLRDHGSQAPYHRRYARPVAGVAVHAANIQDRDGVALVLDRRTRRLFPFIERIYGDGGYQGPKATKAPAKTGCWTIKIVGRSPTTVGFRNLTQALDRRAHLGVFTKSMISPA